MILKSIKTIRFGETSVNNMVSDLVTMPGIELVTDLNITMVLTLWPESVADYGDAVIASLSKSTRNSVVATFDKKLINALTKLDIAVYPMKNE